MIVGILKLDLKILNSFSLKEKRKIIKSLIDRIKNKFNVSCAEVGVLDNHRRALIGISIVSNSKKIIDSQISSILILVERLPEIEIIDKEIEI